MDYFYSIGIAQVLFSLVLIGKKDELMLADKVLMALIASFGLELVYSGLNFVYIPALPNVIMFPYLYGPLLYMYALFMVSEKPRFSNKLYLHFIPFAVFVLLVMFGGKFIYHFKISFIKSADNSWFHTLNFIGFIASLVYYSVQIIKMMKEHRHNLHNKFSVDSASYNLSWINYLTTFVFGSFIVFITSDTIMSLTGVFLFESSLLIHIGIVIATYSLSFFGFRQEAIFEEQHFDRFEEQPAEVEQVEKVGDKERLLQYLEEEKPYLIRNLTLQDLANELSMPPYRVSELINSELGKNFFTLINELRVEEAKQRILSGAYSHLTLSAIGFDAGFNSKSTFQALFKKYTGMTPSQFKKKQ